MNDLDFTPSADAPPVLKPAKRGIASVPVWAWFLVACIGAVILGGVAMAVVVVAKRAVFNSDKASDSQSGTVTRSELEQWKAAGASKGRTVADVQAYLGRPDLAENRCPHFGCSAPSFAYVYYDKVIDGAHSGKPYRETVIFFTDPKGFVHLIHYD